MSDNKRNGKAPMVSDESVTESPWKARSDQVAMDEALAMALQQSYTSHITVEDDAIARKFQQEEDDRLISNDEEMARKLQAMEVEPDNVTKKFQNLQVKSSPHRDVPSTSRGTREHEHGKSSSLSSPDKFHSAHSHNFDEIEELNESEELRDEVSEGMAENNADKKSTKKWWKKKMTDSQKQKVTDLKNRLGRAIKTTVKKASDVGGHCKKSGNTLEPNVKSK